MAVEIDEFYENLAPKVAGLASDSANVATATGGAATLHKLVGKITSEALTTAAGATYTLTLTNTEVAAADNVFASVDANGSAGTPAVARVEPAAGSLVIVIQNIHASAAFDGAITVSLLVVKAT